MDGLVFVVLFVLLLRLDRRRDVDSLVPHKTDHGNNVTGGLEACDCLAQEYGADDDEEGILNGCKNLEGETRRHPDYPERKDVYNEPH